MHRWVGVGILSLASLLPAMPVQAQAVPQLPAGFTATVFASGVSSPTAIALGPDARLYIAEENGSIVAIGPAGRAVVASGLPTPLGLAWHAGKLYVSATGEVVTLVPTKRFRSFSRRTIIRGLPTGRHQNDGMAFNRGWLYVGVGSTCDACIESNARSASIMRFHLDGSHAQIYAHGLRNPYGLAFRPGTNQLYATDNGRDDHGNSVPDELNRIVRGGKYGWPDCWGDGGGSNCKGTIAPVALFEPHSSADGLAFYTGHTYPAAYQGDAFVAEWGDSVNNLDTGRRVKRIHFSGKRVTVSDFATGLSHPLAVTMGNAGTLLVADYGTGTIWRIQATGRTLRGV